MRGCFPFTTMTTSKPVIIDYNDADHDDDDDEYYYYYVYILHMKNGGELSLLSCECANGSKKPKKSLKKLN